MALVDDLKRERRLYIECPACQEEFRASEAGLFDATRKLAPDVLARLAELRDALSAQRKEFRDSKRKKIDRVRRAARTANIGKAVEHIAPSLSGFPVAPADCRALFNPIDYVVFGGLAAGGVVDWLGFVDVKSGQASLTKEQRDIKALVEDGKVEFRVAEARR